MYQYRRTTEVKKLGVEKLPLNLLDALRVTIRSKELRAGVGDELIDSYNKLKMIEWDHYASHLSHWERDNTLDC
jgi:glutamine synthetase